MSDDRNLEMLLIDSTAVRAHQHTAGAQQKTVRRRSRGHLSTTIHASVVALAPLRLLLSTGQVPDVPQVSELIEGLSAQMVVGDKEYDVQPLIEHLAHS